MGAVAVQLPAAYSNFYSTSTQVSAALIGLLFVSVSISTDSVFGEKATLRNRLRAYSAFTALVNAFFLSFTSILPGPRIGVYAVSLGALALSDTFMNFAMVLRERGTGRIGALITTVLSAGLYVDEVVLGALLLSRPLDLGLLSNLNTLIIGAYAFGLARAWALLGGESGHRVLHRLSAVVRQSPATSERDAEKPPED